MVEITVGAALVAAIGHVDMDAEGNTQALCPFVHLDQQAHGLTVLSILGSSMGRSETNRIPCCDSASTNCFASCCAISGSTANAGQTFCSTISVSGVRPSAACQMTVATSFKVKKVESAADMIIISPPRMRAAIAELRAM